MATINLIPSFNAHLHNQPFTKTISTPHNLGWRFPKTARRFPTPARWSPLKCTVSSTVHSDVGVRPLCDKWRKIHGEDNWAGMLDPMDPMLRSELIRYGELTQATYLSFDNDPYSKYCGSCKFPPKTFFQDLEMKECGYEVANYIYSSNTSNLIPKFFMTYLKSDGPWNPMVNWIGYVAVSNDEKTAELGRRDIIVAWRGTVTKLEWVGDLMNFLKPVSAQNLESKDPNIKVMAGFLHIYTDKDQSCPYSKYSARELVMAQLTRLTNIAKEKGEDISITITGHSLGSALATLNAYDIAESDIVKHDTMKRIPITVFSFSGPRVGNTRFRKRVEELGIKVLRVFNVHDTVPNVPGVLFNENTSGIIQQLADWIAWFYSHVGEELSLDHKRSTYVKEDIDVAEKHNLELLMHLIDGYHGKESKFVLATGRDKALVNKEGDILLDEHLIPPNWLQTENKKLQKNENGEWRLPEQGGIEDHLRPEEVELHLKMLGLS